MRLLGLKDTVISEPPTRGDEDEEAANRNEEAYAELIQYLDDKSLSLVMRDAADDGRKALRILRAYYAGKETANNKPVHRVNLPAKNGE